MHAHRACAHLSLFLLGSSPKKTKRDEHELLNVFFLYIYIYTILHVNIYITCVHNNYTYPTRYVTVKTFPKIGAFFCKGLPACMHIGHARHSFVVLCLSNIKQQRNDEGFHCKIIFIIYIYNHLLK